MKNGKLLNAPHKVIHYPLSSKGRLAEEQDVTTVIGICCKDGLVIGADSKATRGPSMREEYLKIWRLKAGMNFQAVITGAGRGVYISKYRDLLESVCAPQHGQIDSLATFVQMAEQMMQDMTRRYGTERMARLGLLVPENGTRMRSPIDFFPDVVAVIGVCDFHGPHLFEVTADGVAEEQQNFGAAGSGGPYADYLLPKFCGEKMTVSEAVLVAIHVIDEVKHVDPDSGGPTQIAVVTEDGVKHWTATEIAEASNEVRNIEKKAAGVWQKAVKAQARILKKTVKST